MVSKIPIHFFVGVIIIVEAGFDGARLDVAESLVDP